MAQRVLITGGGSGIGYAMAQAFGSIGAQVWVTDIDQTALDDCPKDWLCSQPTWPKRIKS
jgi:NAD(P)-dependent dehydrogenase (short-subunit alcohol dehydrogenase family)